MHIPDHFLNSGAAGSLMGMAAAAVGFAVNKVRSAFLEKVPELRARLATFPNIGAESGMSLRSRLSKYGREKMWRMAVVGSFIFSAQMLNFPVGKEMSGHMLGGVLAAIIIGPLEALIVFAVVLAMQALLLGDGGLLALGANIVNLGVIGAVGGYAYFQFLNGNRKDEKRYFLIRAFVAAWLSVIFAAICASVEIAFSGVQTLWAILPSMVLVHTVIGLFEGAITALILALLIRQHYPLEALDEEKTYGE